LPSSSSNNSNGSFITPATNWNQCIVTLNQAKALDLPQNLKDRVSKLLDYCDLRIASYNCLYRQLQTGDDQNADSMNYYNTQIQSILSDLQQP
jgi:rhomboid protease GluP